MDSDVVAEARKRLQSLTDTQARSVSATTDRWEQQDKANTEKVEKAVQDSKKFASRLHERVRNKQSEDVREKQFYDFVPPESDGREEAEPTFPPPKRARNGRASHAQDDFEDEDFSNQTWMR